MDAYWTQKNKQINKQTDRQQTERVSLNKDLCDTDARHWHQNSHNHRRIRTLYWHNVPCHTGIVTSAYTLRYCLHTCTHTHMYGLAYTQQYQTGGGHFKKFSIYKLSHGDAVVELSNSAHMLKSEKSLWLNRSHKSLPQCRRQLCPK